MPGQITPRTHIPGTVPSFVAVKPGSKSHGAKKSKTEAHSSFALDMFSYKRFYMLLVLFVPFFLTHEKVIAKLCSLLPSSVCEQWQQWLTVTPSKEQSIWEPYLTALTHLPWPAWIVLLVCSAMMMRSLLIMCQPHLLFAYNCFLKPFLQRNSHQGVAAGDHQKRLEAFYQGQAQVYDVTRKRLLRGRNTMLKLCAAQLRQVYPLCDYQPGESAVSVTDPSHIPSPLLSPRNLGSSALCRRYAWVEIGGGTGENIEKMNRFFPVKNFAKVYLIDITPSLCEIARKRFQALGWTNVTVLCMDATAFEIPQQDEPETMDIALITCSYSLSMMETFYPLIDRLSTLLSPQGVIGISDFYVSNKRSHDPTRQLSWFQRWFWAVWFDFDNIYLHASRREYLEHKFVTIKQFNGKNPFIKHVVSIPYYVWIGGKPKDPSAMMEEMELEKGEQDGVALMVECCDDNDLKQDIHVDADDLLSDKEDDVPVVSASLDSSTVTATHYHGQGQKWRVPFDISLIPRFSTYIYAFAWEDPRVDLEYLNLTREDTMLVITSGGCNVLEYASAVGPKRYDSLSTLEPRIYSVDLNPCQNHLLELKLAAISSLDYNDFWKLFGEGYLPDFGTILDTHLSPHLSPFAYHFWKNNKNFSNLFKTGCSGLAVRVFQFLQKVKPGLSKSVYDMCHAETLQEQWTIWEKQVRPHFLSTWLIKLLNNERFLWGALGVPPAQMQMILEEGNAYQYVVNTFDPIIKHSHLLTDNYFYYMPLNLKYAPNNCPRYLTEQGFSALKQDPSRLDAIQIHTDTILQVLDKVQDEELTRTILMDHLDWFSEEDARKEIEAVYKKTKKGGKVYWRSGGKHPWYNVLFTKAGFQVEALQTRQGETLFIDRVNMYASFYCGVKN